MMKFSQSLLKFHYDSAEGLPTVLVFEMLTIALDRENIGSSGKEHLKNIKLLMWALYLVGRPN